MLRYIFISIAILACLGVKAQDLIVTIEGDSIECHIVTMTHNMVNITFIQDSIVKKAVMPRDMVAFYAVDYKEDWEEVPTVQHAPGPPKMRLRVGGGMSNLIGAIPSNIPEEFIPYVEELKSGNHFVADITFYQSERIGLGIRYSYFRTKNRMSNIYVIDTAGTITYGDLEDDIKIQFIGPGLGFRKTLPRGGAQVVYNLSMGIINYFNDARVVDKLRIRGSTVGFSGDIGLDFQLEDGFHLGVGVGVILGIIKTIELEQDGLTQTIPLENSEYNNVSRFDLSISLSYYL